MEAAALTIPMQTTPQSRKRQAIGLRPALIRIHTDLLVVHYHATPWKDFFPEHLTMLEKLVIALEDRRYLQHAGLDWKAICREAVKAMLLREHGGASTIDMQFVRTATGYRKRTISRKCYEILLALLIQYRYSKLTILRSYLGCAFFGSRLIGADAASKKLYGIGANELDLDQAAFIAAMLVYPRPLRETDSWRNKVIRRAEYGKRIYIASKKRFDQLPR